MKQVRSRFPVLAFAVAVASAVVVIDLCRLGRGSGLHTPEGTGPAFAGLGRPEGRWIAKRSSALTSHALPLQWLQVEDGPEVKPSANSTVLPVFPFSEVLWPGRTVLLKITDAFQSRMYDDILASGSRRIVVPFTKTRADGRTRMADMDEEDRRLHAFGAVLYLTGLKDVSETSGGTVKYIAEHIVTGRARINRLLNPAVLFVNDDDALFEQEYLLGEVDILEDGADADGTFDEGVVYHETQQILVDTWQDLQVLCTSLDEPRLQHDSMIHGAVNSSTWKVAALMGELQKSLKSHRQHVSTHAEVKEWIQTQQQMGALPRNLPKQLDADAVGMPAALVEKLKKAQAQSTDLGSDFWHPFLQIFAAQSAERRSKLFVQMLRAEVHATRVRVMLRDALV